MKDYYAILGVSRNAREEEIRTAYRRAALKYHPDRNSGDPRAEERFKEVAEAYGVLIDPVKRRNYEQSYFSGTRHRTTSAGGGFRYSQEEIFKDLFRDPRFSSVFQELFREFERNGLRTDSRFFNQTFFGGRGMVFGGIFFFGPFGAARPRHMPRSERPRALEGRPGILERVGRKIGAYLIGSKKEVPARTEAVALRDQDLAYGITLNREDARRGTSVKIAVDRGRGRELLKVKIPPGTKPGSRLRLKGKGRQGGLPGLESGDLYLTVQLK